MAVALNPAIDRVLEVPSLTIGAHQHARLISRSAAGKGVNVARCLSQLDVPSVLTGLVGQEDLPFFTRSLTGTSVQMRMAPVAGRTRENITLVDPIAHTETHLRDRGFEVLPTELDAVRRQLDELAGPGTLFVFSGSLPPGIQPADQAQMVRQCRQAGSRVAIDASGPALAASVEADPWLIKPNHLELEELLGRKLADTDDAIKSARQLTRSVEVVLASFGSEGACAFSSQAAWHGRCAVPDDRLISTVGCGDALLAGFIAGIYRRLPIEESLRWATAAAAATATSQTATFTRQQFDEFLPDAETMPLDRNDRAQP